MKVAQIARTIAEIFSAQFASEIAPLGGIDPDADDITYASGAQFAGSSGTAFVPAGIGNAISSLNHIARDFLPVQMTSNVFASLPTMSPG